jgi:N-acetylmuramoyl-L-alanine amidase
MAWSGFLLPETTMKLCIDAGHGMSNVKPGKYDSGATGGGLQEADISLQWALTGKWVCQKHGIQVFMTRDDDRDPDPVATRDDRAEVNLCSHFIALHCNSGGGTGLEAYYRDNTDAKLARMVLDVAVRVTGGKSRGIKAEGHSQHPRLAVFDFDGPTTLIELGFIDNAKDRAWLASREARIAFWEGVCAELLK